VAVGDLDDAMRRPFARDRQLEYAARHRWTGKTRGGNRDDGIEKHRAIVISSAQRRCAW
jgi:hypothetical protein